MTHTTKSSFKSGFTTNVVGELGSTTLTHNNTMGFRLSTPSKKRLEKVIKRAELISKDIEPTFERAAVKAIAKMKQDAPKDTRRLKRNITFQRSIDGVTITSVALDPKTKYDYAPVQNFGGRFITATLYFTKNIRYFNRKIRRDVKKLFSSITN